MIGPGRLFLLILLLTGPDLARAGSPIEVVRVRVPAQRVSGCFPPGATLRTMPTDQFEALLARATAGALDVADNPPRRPIRIEHFARWDGEMLAGRSRVTLPATTGSSRSAVVLCDPWSPAVLESADQAQFVRSDPQGRLILIQPANEPARVVEITWRQAARSESGGTVFALRLPNADLATLALELPAEASATAPSPRLESTTDRTRWRFAGAVGPFPIQIHPESRRATGPNLWLGGTTRIDLNAAGANWVADWQVETGQAGPITATVDLDPSLELIDVAGPDVRGYHLVPPGNRRVEIALEPQDQRGAAVGGTPLTIRAHAQVPVKGTWSVPSAWPVAGTAWLGGRTEVRLDPARAVVATTERAGRRTVARPADPAPPAPWIFESDGRAGPVADLVLAAPETDASVEIAGTLRTGPLAPRIEAIATWTIGGDPLLDPTLDFPPGWVVDLVAPSAGDSTQHLPWHTEATPGGGSRIHFDGSAWPTEPAQRTITARVAATRVEPGNGDAVTGLLELPRVRPTTGPVRVVAEHWVAEIAPGWEAVPTASRGLVWDDLLVPETDATATAAIPSGTRLAWRWVAADAGATIERRRQQGKPQVDERVEAAIGGGRLRLIWFWTLAGVARPDPLPFAIDLDPRFAPRWRFAERLGGPVVPTNPLDPARQTLLGWPANRFAADLPTTHLPPGPINLRGETEIPWDGSGSIPMTRFPAAIHVRRSVVVRVEETTRCRIDRADGLGFVGRGEVGDPATTPESESSPYRAIVGDDEPGFGIVGAWLGDGGPVRLDLTTLGSAANAEPAGLITEASLTSRLAPGTPGRHRLVLRVVPGSTRQLDLKLPAGSTLDRIRRDGQPAVVTTDSATLRIHLSRSDPGRLNSTTTLDYRTPAALSHVGLIRPADFLPTISLPCMSMVWQVNTPESIQVRSAADDLIATDLVADVANVSDQTATTGPSETAMLADLDQTLTTARPVATTLGDWLIKLDAGPWPILVDRLALLGVGLGPRSRVNVAPPENNETGPLTARAVFESLGLAIEPTGATLLVTTGVNRRIDLERARLTGAERAALGATLFEASIAGSDRSDRFQSPERWRGEPTPRAWLASETPDRGLVAVGWRPHRFVASSWPAAGMAIELTDARTSWRLAGLIAIGLGALILLVGALRVAVRRGRSRTAAVLLVLFVLTGSSQAERAGDPEPILVILPYDDLAQVESTPPRVILLEADYDRLIQLAAPVAFVEPVPVALLGVTHRIRRSRGAREAVVESRYQIEVAGSNPRSWALPVGPAFDLTATVAAEAVPLSISPDGSMATVASIPPGRSTVIVRRSVAVQGKLDLSADMIDLPINPSPLARVEVDNADETQAVDLPGLIGRQIEPQGRIAGDLGPAGQLVAQWGRASTGWNSGLVLTASTRWDAGSAGDRLSSRITVGGTRPVESLHLTLEPGLAVIGQSIPGLVGTTTSQSADSSAWVAEIDPPLPPGSLAEVTLWRPRTTTALIRTCPQWSVRGAVLTGLVGLWKPEDWSGRFVGFSGPAAPLEVEFGRTWDSLPVEGFTMVGATRWQPDQPARAEVARQPADLGVRDRVAVTLSAGELQVMIDSILTERYRPTWEAEIRFDSPLRVNRVEGVGLQRWTQTSPDRVHLVFDGAEPSRDRAVHLEGTILLDPRSGERVIRQPIPWPRWRGATADPGRLVVRAPEGWLVRAGDSILPAEPPRTSSESAGLSMRNTRTIVRRGDPILQLEGSVEDSRVNVAIASDLRLDLGRIEWAAEVHSEIAGGPIRALFWQLPTRWAAVARLETSEGAEPAVAVENRGETTVWTITFPEPVWTHRKLTIHAALPVEPGTTVAYPEVVPLSPPGRGEVRRYDLTLTNLAGASLTLVDPVGLTPLNHSRIRSEPSTMPGGVVSRAFRVSNKAWSLGIRLAAEPPAGSIQLGHFDTDDRRATVEQADFEATLDTAGQLQGRADCRVRPGAAWLAVQLRAGGKLVGATVDGRAVMPVKPASPTQSQLWLIPLGDRGALRVVFGWVQLPLNHPSRNLPLPSFDQPAIPISVQIATTHVGGNLSMTGGNWSHLKPAGAALSQFQRLGGDLIAAARRADHDPTAVATSEILAQLTTLKLSLRSAGRAARMADDSAPPNLAEWLTTQDQVQAAIREAGLGSLLEVVQQRVGLIPTEVDPARVGPLGEIPDPFRVRRIGAVEHFEGVTAADPHETPAIVIKNY